MTVVDCHVHLYPEEINRDPAAWTAAHRETQFARLCLRRRRDGRPVQGFPSVDGLLRELDAAGIDRALLLGWYWEHAASCALQNRFLADCVRRHPDRLWAFAAVQPGARPEDCLAELARARDEGLAGIGELSPHAQGCPLDSPGLAAVLGWAGDEGWPVNLHVTDPAGRPYPGRVETPLGDLTALARRFPRTPFILAHWGGGLPVAAEGRDPLPNLWYDTAASPLLYDASVWSRIAPAVPPGRLLFGSDHPLELYPSVPGNGLARFLAEARAGGAGAEVLGSNALSLIRGGR